MIKNYEILDSENQIVKMSETIEINNERVLSVQSINDRITQIDFEISEFNKEKTELQADLDAINQLLA